MFQDLSNILVDKRGAIIANDFIRYAKPCDNVLSDEISRGRTGCLAKGNGFDPLWKIFGSYQDLNVSVERWINRANEV